MSKWVKYGSLIFSLLIALRMAFVSLSRSDAVTLSGPELHDKMPSIEHQEDQRIGKNLMNDISLRLLFENGFILYTRSFCMMAAWSFPQQMPGDVLGKRNFIDCGPGLSSPYLFNTTVLRPFDTIHVGFKQIVKFVDTFLPKVSVPIVVLSGYSQWVDPSTHFPAKQCHDMIQNKHVLAWFVHSPDFNVKSVARHPKVFSLPFGLHQKTFMRYRHFLNQSLQSSWNKSIHIFVSKLGETTTSRKNIPSGPSLGKEEYYLTLSRSKYILSPNGDRPECYRHYESIGLGVMPVTELDSSIYSHFGSNAIYNSSDWDLSSLEAKLPKSPQVNQRLVFEEYWMEYIEFRVRHSLFWWDKSTNQRVNFSYILQRIKGDLEPTWHMVRASAALYARGKMEPINESA